MPFEIDTGFQQRVITDLIPGWLQDMLPADATEAQIVRAYAHHIMGDMKRPKKLDTVRGHVIAQWQFLRMLADTNPGLFDEIWIEYAERAATFD